MSVPLGSHDRLVALDILRGFALFGVLLVNYELWFRTTPLRYEQSALPFPGLVNQGVDALVSIFFSRRFMGLFAFLFGVGLAVQSQRADRSFLFRRLGVLFLFGVFHVLLVWSGDILHLYALIGVPLVLLVLERRPRTIAIGAGTLVALPPIVGTVVALVRGATYQPPAESPELASQIGSVVEVFGRGSWFEIAVARLEEYVQFLPERLGSAAFSFLFASLGVLAWKTGILRNPGRHRRALLWTLAAGGLFGLGHAVIQLCFECSAALREFGEARMIFANFTPAALVSTVFAYAAAILLLTGSISGRRLLSPLAAVGKMALTNYLLQSVIGSMIFFGFGLGLYDRLGPFEGALIVVVLYAAQVVASNLWLGAFRFGPVEWLWRSLSYRRRQPWKLAPALCAELPGAATCRPRSR